MASTKTAVPNAAAIFLSAVQLWQEFASGTYTSWSWVSAPDSGHIGIKVTVGLSGGGTDDHTFISLADYLGEAAPVSYPMQLPGWRMAPVGPYPATLPSGDNCVASFGAVRSLKQTLYELVTGAGLDHQYNTDTAAVYGITLHFWVWVHLHDLGVTVDSVGVLYGTATIDGLAGVPTDVIGADQSPVTLAQSGSGGSIDLTPVVAALEDIATREIDYSANQGGEVWSLVGKVRT